jgi:anti-sigma regulatory factor (Ser/Thr protein kinase)
MLSSLRIIVGDESQIGQARRTAADTARELGSSVQFAGRLAILVTEGATNLVRHGGGGEILLRRLRVSEGVGLDVLVLDRGPGMRSITECLRDGYSSAGTAGNGLGAIRRLADEFEIVSTPGRGTAIWCRMQFEKESRPKPPAFLIGAVNVAVEKEEVCGDCWDAVAEETNFRLMLADGLGHGALAHDAAQAAVAVLRREPMQSLSAVMDDAHRQLRQTRGAAVLVVGISPDAGAMLSCGVGNIAARVVGESGTQHLISSRGTVGGSAWKAQEYSNPWHQGALLVLHSDGLSSRWTLDDHPGLIHRHPGLIAGVLYRDHRRERDDATVVVVRQKVSA